MGERHCSFSGEKTLKEGYCKKNKTKDFNLFYFIFFFFVFILIILHFPIFRTLGLGLEVISYISYI